MRYLLAAALTFLTAAVPCRADILLEHVYRSGYTLEEMSFSITCSLSESGQLGIERRAGASLRSHSVLQLQMSLPPLKASIAEAAKGEISSVEPFPVDGPTRTYTAYRTLADGRRTEVTLSEESGDIGRKRVNASPAATRLMRFLDMHCGSGR